MEGAIKDISKRKTIYQGARKKKRGDRITLRVSGFFAHVVQFARTGDRLVLAKKVTEKRLEDASKNHKVNIKRHR